MTTPHRATPEQWALIEQHAEFDCYSDDCLLELRDRLAAAEQRISDLERNHFPDVTKMVPAATRRPLLEPSANHIAECGGPCQEGFWHCNCGLLEQLNPELRPAPAAPAGSLVEAVQRAIHDTEFPHGNDEARAAIYEVADWLESQDVGAGRAAARWLREEVERD